MERLFARSLAGRGARVVNTLLFSLVLMGLFFIDCHAVQAIPAFARKYGMPCSACHESWPMLNWFGQQFKDNGYQLGNDRDAPIFQNPAYWPATFRITPNWSRNSTDKVAVDGSNGPSANEAKITTNGFNWSGLPSTATL